MHLLFKISFWHLQTRIYWVVNWQSNDENSDVEIKFLPTTVDQDGEHTIMCKLVHKPSDTLVSTYTLITNGGDDDKFQEEPMKGLYKTGKKLAK